jgi:hypothetical protein
MAKRVIQMKFFEAGRYSKALFLTAGAAAMLMIVGCSSHHYYYAAAPPPPPPAGYAQRPPLVEIAQRNGHIAGRDDGARDAYRGSGYRPNHDRNFRATPGYDPALGPFDVYRQSYRDSYLRGYDEGYRGLR